MMTMSATGTIVVSRPSGGYRDLLRSYAIDVDGARAARVKAGGRAEIAVPAGEHDVRGVIDWLGSPTLRVGVPAGAEVELTVRPGGTPFAAPWQMRRRDTYLSLTAGPGATEAPLPTVRLSAGRVVRMLLLAAIGFAGIYFFFRGAGDLMHGGSHSAGVRYLALGVACYLGALVIGRLLRRRDKRAGATI
jgi:hypothetical protein